MTTKVIETLTQQLKELHLPAIREQFEPLAQHAGQESWSYEQYLAALTQSECEARSNHRIDRLLRQSQLPLEKNLDAFNLKRLPWKLRQILRSLMDGSFLDRCENILAFGRPGCGKTHALCAIGQELIRRGRKVYFTSCSLLVQELLLAKRDLKLSRALKRLAVYDAIIIDDLGYVQQSREEMEVLFTLLADRYEKSSIMITSNLPFSQWEAIFKDPMTTAAAIDRLVHHSVILEFNLISFRLEEAQKNQGQSQPPQLATATDSTETTDDNHSQN
jgi:DNA replication protein DnaC